MEECHGVFSFLHLCSRSLEGAYGPFYQTIAIAIFFAIFTLFIRVILTRLEKILRERERIWSLSFVTAMKKPLNTFVWVVAFVCSLDILSENVFSIHPAYLHLFLKISAVLTFSWFFAFVEYHSCKKYP